MVFDIRLVLKLKAFGCYTTCTRYDLDIPAKTKVEVEVRVPNGYAWFVPEEIHGNIPFDIFYHRSLKDEMEILPRQLIGASNLHIRYAIPFLIEERFIGEIENTDTVTRHFELFLPFAVVPVSYIEVAKKEMGLA